MPHSGPFECCHEDDPVPVGAFEPNEQILEQSRVVDGKQVSTTVWRLSVEGEYVLKTVLFYESDGSPDAKWTLQRTLRTIVRKPPGVHSERVREELTSTHHQDKSIRPRHMHDHCILSGLGEIITMTDMDLEGHSGGSGRAAISARLAEAGGQGAVVHAARSFRFTHHKSDLRKKVRFTIKTIDHEKALLLAEEAGLRLPPPEKLRWSLKLPEGKPKQDGNERVDRPARIPAPS